MSWKDYVENVMLKLCINVWKHEHDEYEIWWARAWNEIINVERKIEVERYIGRASVRPLGIKPQGIKNKKQKKQIINIERKTKVERYLGKVSVRPLGIKPQGIRNKIGGSSPTANSNQSKCKTTGYKVSGHQKQKTKEINEWQAWHDVWYDFMF